MIKDKIKKLIIDTVGWLSCLTIIFFFSTLWLYSYNDTEQAFHEAWSTSVSFLSALSTLAAAVVAAYLFNDWRDQEKYRITSNLAMECLQDYVTAKDKLFFYLFQHVYNTKPITYEELDDLFFKSHIKITTLNEALRRLNKPQICEKIINSFYVKHYREVISNANSDEKLKKLDIKILNEYHKNFLDNTGRNKLPDKLLDILKMD